MGITPKICIWCFVLINSVVLNLSRVWISPERHISLCQSGISSILSGKVRYTLQYEGLEERIFWIFFIFVSTFRSSGKRLRQRGNIDHQRESGGVSSLEPHVTNFSHPVPGQVITMVWCVTRLCVWWCMHVLVGVQVPGLCFRGALSGVSSSCISALHKTVLHRT